MNVSLPADLEELINETMSNGGYESPRKVIEEALSLLHERDRAKQFRLEQLRRDIKIGVEQADRGEVAPLNAEDIKSEGRRTLATNGT